MGPGKYAVADFVTDTFNTADKLNTVIREGMIDRGEGMYDFQPFGTPPDVDYFWPTIYRERVKELQRAWQKVDSFGKFPEPSTTVSSVMEEEPAVAYITHLVKEGKALRDEYLPNPKTATFLDFATVFQIINAELLQVPETAEAWQLKYPQG